MHKSHVYAEGPPKPDSDRLASPGTLGTSASRVQLAGIDPHVCKAWRHFSTSPFPLLSSVGHPICSRLLDDR